MLAYCDRRGDQRLKLVIILAIETAMRRSEIVRGLTWQNVDLHRQLAYLADTKNGDARVVPLSLRAAGALQGNARPSGFVVDLDRDAITRGFVAACRACEIEGFRLHDLRHEATSRLFEKGFNMMEVSTITGHKSLAMLKRYTHLRPLDLLARLE